MWDFIIGTVVPLIGTFSVGVLGWFMTHWFAAPIIEIEKIRQQIREDLFFYQHLAQDWPPDQINEAACKLRRVSARVGAASVASSRIVRWYFQSVRGWDLPGAQSILLGLSNVSGTSRDERTILKYDIECALKLPTNESPERIERIKKRIDSNSA